jgi:hypothetical protein
VIFNKESETNYNKSMTDFHLWKRAKWADRSLSFKVAELENDPSTDTA